MNKFGVLKTKILTKLTESYSIGDMEQFKDIFNTVKKNNELREMYLFYEDIESKCLEDKDTAKQYINEMVTLLKPKIFSTQGICKHLKIKLHSVDIVENEVYSAIDQLLEDDSLFNIDKKIIAKNKLVEYLVSKKDVPESGVTSITENENLLNAVLTNNFNILYGKTLSENEKKELNGILSLSTDELNSKFTELKESIESSIKNIISEGSSTEIKDRLEQVTNEISLMKVNKHNYYKLKELKNGLN